ncbi:MAG: sulfotransferase family protein [Burkholderiaceae bacterium]
MKQQAVFIIGMHRSGTSAAAGALHLLGVDLAKTYQAQEGVNERGFWEHADLVDTHDTVLRLLGSAWDDILPIPAKHLEGLYSHKVTDRLRSLLKRDFENSQIWGFKDPRICRLLPIWFHLETGSDFSLKCWLVTRDPEEVAASLSRRNSFPTEKSMLLWLSHTLEAEHVTRGHLRTHSTYDDLLADPVAVYTQVNDELDLKLDAKIQDQANEIRAFLTSDLRHHKHTTGRDQFSGHRFAALAIRTYELLRNEKGQISTSACAALDQLKAEFDDLVQQLDPMIVDHLRSVSAARGKYERYFFEAYHSIWWKLAAPLRAIEKRIRP